MKKLVIVGASLFGEVVAAYFERFTRYEVVAFAADLELIDQTEFAGRPVISLDRIAEAYPPEESDAFVAIGYTKMNAIRRSKCEELQKRGYELASFVHPNVDIWDSTEVGRNCFIFEDNTIQPYTRIGSGTIMWSGNHMGHHSRIGEYNFVSSHVVISGSCLIGDQCFFGVNSTVFDGLSLGDRSLVGAGAIVSRDLPEESLVIAKSTVVDARKTSELDF